MAEVRTQSQIGSNDPLDPPPKTKAPRKRTTPGGREEAKRRTRARLIQAALKLFLKQGFAGPSLDAICAEAGYTRGAFYVHFESREDLVAAVMEWSLGLLFDDILGAGEPDGDLASTIERYVSIAARGRTDLSVESSYEIEAADTTRGVDILTHQILEASERSPSIRAQLQATIKTTSNRVGKLIAADQARGQIRSDVEPDALGDLLVVLALGLTIATDLRLPIQLAPSRAALLDLLKPNSAAVDAPSGG